MDEMVQRKWTVTVKQNLKYEETLVSEFYDGAKACEFADLILATCKNVEIEITVSNLAIKESEDE